LSVRGACDTEDDKRERRCAQELLHLFERNH
jgi:hypothetical protein